SFQMPRRYLTAFVGALGVACFPLAVIGFTDQLWVIVMALFVYGFIFSGASVIWGTLLQRRVPPDMIGRVSSLDGFVSLALFPVSLALAGPVAEWVGIPIAFLIAGVVPLILAALTLTIARLGPDELAHPLDDAPGRELADPGV
ncbi:MAG: MFS transporter, partial [Microcella sp.]|nr:MFS transporter [Microcella sp.]